MTISFSQHQDQGYFIAKYIGLVSDDDLLESWTRYMNSNEWDPKLNELTDLSESDFSNVTSDGIIHLAAFTAKKYQQQGVHSVKVAVYAPTALPYGLSRIYEAYTYDSAENLKTFGNREEALQWLLDN